MNMHKLFLPEYEGPSTIMRKGFLVPSSLMSPTEDPRYCSGSDAP
ncbi:hypothetical protein PR003_g19629 [Phytophthora rubi]|uniref:Uncharacterized protein n=1 Tax=Phytophthora rubi TaxID=129364 RepID=A0A6A3JU12_9STRA|nr:hypothetical protein PR001_g19230 [Phytophthora rubi]KAE9312963.1 hypothetical protein PR003_g19629 [Phytophthora rubi]